MKEMVEEATSLISTEKSDRLTESFGKLLHESWTLKKSLSSQVSNKLIDEAYEKAIASGAWGGKITGAGGGGFLLFIVPLRKQTEVRNALNKFVEVDFNFENEGSSIIYLRD